MVEKPWSPIEDLPANWPDLASPDLRVLGPLWLEQKDRLASSDSYSEFTHRLRRRWSIETGIIERLYDIDRGVTQILIERGLLATLIPHGATDRPVDEVIAILQDHEEAFEGLWKFVNSQRPLSVGYLRQLHAALTRHQETCAGRDQFGNTVHVPLVHGEWKKWPNNPARGTDIVMEYCPPEHVPAEMDRLVEMHAAHDTVAPEVEAAWLHHRFTQIHPFQDGNGRMARCLAALVCMKGSWIPPVITRDHRPEYIQALEEADRGDLGRLIRLFGVILKDSFLEALSLAQDVLRAESGLKAIVAAAARDHQARDQAAEDERARTVAEAVEGLAAIAQERMDFAAGLLQQEFGARGLRLDTGVSRSTEENDFWFRWQIVQVAKLSKYFAPDRKPRAWVRLHVKGDGKTDIVVAVHPVGTAPGGPMVATCFVTFKRAADPDQYESEVLPACDGAFVFAPAAAEANREERFRRWAETSLQVALELWRRRT